MKKLIVLILLLAALSFAGEKHNHDKKAADHSAMHQTDGCKLEDGQKCVQISVPTVQCDMCVKTISNAVKATEKANVVNIDLEKKVAHVHLNKGAELTDVETAISNAGYDANKTPRDEKAHGKLPECCQSTK